MEDQIQPEVAKVYHEVGGVEGGEGSLIRSLDTLWSIAPWVIDQI
jgi:hypothetical protein